MEPGNSKNTDSTANRLKEIALISSFSYAALTIPYALTYPYSLSFGNFTQVAVEAWGWETLIIILFVGIVAGVKTKTSSAKVGLSTMLFFPLNTIIEIAINPSSHNLWPLEFALYFAFSVVGLFGFGIGDIIKTLITRIKS